MQVDDPFIRDTRPDGTVLIMCPYCQGTAHQPYRVSEPYARPIRSTQTTDELCPRCLIFQQAITPQQRIISIPPRYILDEKGKEQQAYKRQLVAEYEQAGWLERLSFRFANAPRWKQELEEDDRLDREHEERYRKMYGGD